ncbi:phosphodiester glycosidase family protein [Kitasatospora sp. NPDC056327]|uniref:phosphodiester glycosidase family protein n=1 Tax=Kitasatospora sp. NPDC056327 TaxID=3345785 RepID=UPI0035E2627F
MSPPVTPTTTAPVPSPVPSSVPATAPARRRTRRPAAVLALGALVAAGLPALAPAGAWAAPAAPGTPGANGTTADPGLVLDRPGESVVTRREVTPIAPGLTMTAFDRLGRTGWLRGKVLVADLATEGLSVDYLSSGQVTTRQTVTGMARGAGAVAAINGDYFDMNASEAPLGVGVSRGGGLLHAPVEGWNQAVTVGADGLARMAEVFLEGRAALPGGRELTLTGVNTYGLPADGVGLFTPAWGQASRAGVAGGSAEVVEVELRDGRVTAVRDRPGAAVPEGATVLVGREAGARALRELRPGDQVSTRYRPRASFGEVAVAVGGYQVLVRDGVAMQPGENDGNELTARTAVGFSADNRRMYLVTVDGRQADSPGISLPDLAVLMRDMGARNALNMDGGGSSAMSARLPGTAGAGTVSSPSDNGGERAVANGLGLFSAPGSGRVTGFRVRPAETADTANRVFPGLRRTVRALPHDETYGPVNGTVPAVRWTVAKDPKDTKDTKEPREPRAPKGSTGPDGTKDSRNSTGAGSTGTAGPGTVEVSGSGTGAVVTGRTSGPAAVTAAADGAEAGTLPLTVLGAPVRITAGTDPVGLEAVGATARISVTGYDAQGHTAPVEAADITVTGGAGVVETSAAEDGSIALRALADGASATLRLTVGALETAVAVTVGTTEKPFADFSDAAAWKSGNDRAPGGGIAPAAGHDGGHGLRLSYDFTRSTGTRGQYAIAPEGIVLPGQPRSVTMWIEGDGNGAWPRIQYRTAAGVTANLDAPMVTWTGWRKVEFPIPSGVQYPLTFQRFRLMETSAARSYTGALTLADLRVEVAPDVELPVRPRVTDPVVLTAGTVDGRPLRVAVMSDAQFVARAPESDLVQAARRTLRDIAAAEPDLLVIAGDLVDEASPADFALARKVLDEFDRLTGGTVPWHYVPGNHEVMGPGTIDNFRAAFGETSEVFDVKGTRFITLNSALGSFRASGFDQISRLRTTLDAAAQDPSVTGLLLFDHHPTRDPLPDQGSQLGDRKEAGLVEQWLAGFRAGGKSAAMVSGHVGAFHASSVDGVPYLINGNSGKGPAAEPDRGGFTGWTMLGIDPAAGRVTDPYAVPDDASAWLRAEVRARADAVQLNAPGTLGLLESVPVGATFTQDGERTVPVAWPVTARWGGQGVHIGPAAGAPRGSVAAYDPATRTLTGLRPGGATLTVTVGGVTAERALTVGSVPACTTTLRGPQKNLAVTSGVVCLDGATVTGPVLVQPGAALVAKGSALRGPVSARGAAAFVLTDSEVSGPVAVSGSTGQVALLWSTVNGPAHLALNTGGTAVAGSTVRGPLDCAGNTPAPVGGHGTTVNGPKGGQCGAL